MLDWYERLWRGTTRTPFLELLTIWAICGLMMSLVKLGSLLGGDPGAWIGITIGLVLVAPYAFVGMRSRRSPEQETESSEETSSHDQESLDEASVQATIGQRFGRMLKDGFLTWSQTWIALWLLGTLTTLLSKIFEGKGDFQFWISPDVLIGVLVIVALGVPLALLYAAVGCWFGSK